MVVAVVLAGGMGNRTGLEYPKQFARIAGKQVIEYTIEVFQGHPQVDEIVLVSIADYTQHLLELVNRQRYTKVAAVINGGEARFDSTQAALDHLRQRPPQTRLLIHDAVRPFLSHTTIDRCLEALDGVDAVDVVIRSADTLVMVDADGFIESMPDRAKFRRGQTPQAFRLGTIRDAYDRFDRESGISVTDDCGVLLATDPGARIATVDGDPTNIKITEPIDLFLADRMFQSRGDPAVTLAEASTLKDRIAGRVIVIFGGSSGIGSAIADMARSLGATAYVYSRSVKDVDVASRDAVTRALEEVAEREDRIDHVVDTAASLIRRPLLDMPQGDVSEGIRTNLTGAINVATCAYPFLKESRGSVLLFTSSSHTRGRAFSAIYSATKAAVANLSQALAEEWAEAGIRVNCMNPERTATPMRRRSFGVEPAESLLDPDQVARASLAVLVAPISGQIVDVRRATTRDLAGGLSS